MNIQPFISVIVPVYNGANFLPRCLDALSASDYPSFEILVADDGSTDGGAELASKRGAAVLPCKHRRAGPAAARNLAAKNAAGEILLFVDADVVVRKETLSLFAAAFAVNQGISAAFGSYDNSPFERNFLSQYRNLLHHFVHQTSSREASTFWAGLGAIRRADFLAVGGFDAERFAVPSIEDIELGARLRKSGRRILLAPEIQAKHLKKWTAVSILKTDIFCRALPWSKLILTEHGLINDLNLKTSDRASALLVAASLALTPLLFRQPLAIFLIASLLLLLLYLNRRIFRFFSQRKGFLFAVLVFPWQFLYFLYSGSAFAFCWFRYALPQIFGLSNRKSVAGHR